MANEFNQLEFIKILSEQHARGNAVLRTVMPDARTLRIYAGDEEIYSFSFPKDDMCLINELEEIKAELEIEFPIYKFISVLPFNIKITIPQIEEEKCQYNIVSIVNMKILGYFMNKKHDRLPAFDIVVG